MSYVCNSVLLLSFLPLKTFLAEVVSLCDCETLLVWLSVLKLLVKRKALAYRRRSTLT